MKNSFVVGLGALAVAWAGIALGESRLLTFKCGVAGESLTKAQDNNGVHYWTSPTNWTDEAGNMCVPLDDDRLFINVKPGNRSACRFDDYNNSAFDAWGGNRSIPYMKRIEFGPKSGGHNVSDCGFRLKSIAQGGEGLVTRGAGSNAFWLSLIAPGDVICDIGNTSGGTVTFSGAKGVSATEKLGIIKRGPAGMTLSNDGRTNMRALIVEEGTLTCSYATNDMPSGLELCVTGSASAAWLKLTNPQKLSGGCLCSPADLPTTDHGITSANAVTLELCGASSVDEQYFAGQVAGKLSLVWNPNDATKVFSLARAVSSTTGSLTVSNGVLRLRDGASASALSAVDVDGGSSRFEIAAGSGANLHVQAINLTNGGKLKLAAGVLIGADAVTVDGEPVTIGKFYSGDDSVGEAADWIEGAGVVFVPGPAGEVTSATWTGLGNDKLISTAENWEGTKKPDLASRGLTATFATGGDAARLETALKEGFGGLVLSAPAGTTGFAFTAAANACAFLDAGGITTVKPADDSARTYALGWPLMLTAGQTWNLAGTNDTLDVTAPIGSVSGGALVKDGPGRLNLRVANSFACPMTINDGNVVVYDGGAFGDPNVPTTLDLSKATVTFSGVTCPENFLVTHAATRFCAAAGTTNVFTGLVDLREGSKSMQLKGDKNSAFVFRGGLRNGGNFGTNGGAALIVEETPMLLTDRVSMGGTLDLRVPHNELGINHCLFAGMKLYTRVPYAVFYGTASGGYQHTCMRMGMSGYSDFWDMCGCDQAIMELCAFSAGKAEITSAKPATLHWMHVGNRSNATSTDRFYAITNYVKFTGAAMVSYEGDRELCLMREQASTGTLAVVGGTLRFPAAGGAWPGATNVVVSGGTLSLLKKGVFDKSAAIAVSGAGKIELGEGVVQRCASLTTNGVEVLPGVYGSSASGAPNPLEAFFVGKGQLRVGEIGMYILIR